MVSGFAFAAGLIGWSAFAHDDAYIAFRYLRHFVAAGDLSWNPGDRVEGYTNFLDLMLLSPLVWMGCDPIVAARLLHLVSAVALFGLVGWKAGDLAGPERRIEARVFAISTLLTTGAIPVWLWGGLETLLATALVSAGVFVLTDLFVANRNPRPRLVVMSGVMFALGILTRPDNVVVLSASGLAILLLAPGSLSLRLRRCLQLAAAPVAIIGLHEVFRIIYYHDWLPNTFWAKSGVPLTLNLKNGIVYAARSFLFAPMLMAFIGLLAAKLLTSAKDLDAQPHNRLLAFLGLVVGLHCAYVVAVGGDHMAGARFFLPCMGAVAIGVGLLAATADPRLLRGLAAIVVLGSLTSFVQTVRRWDAVDAAQETGRRVGQWIDKAWPAGSLVALHTAGSTPYFANGFTYIDMLGLNDRAIAKSKVPVRDIERAPHSMPGHLRGDGPYVLSRQPDKIILGPSQGTSIDRPWFVGDVQLAEIEEFRRCYALRTVDLPTAANEDAVTFTWYDRICARRVMSDASR